VPQKACVTQDGAPPLIPRQYSVGPSSVQVASQDVLASHVIELAHVSRTQDPPEHISPVVQSPLLTHPTQLEPLQMGDAPLHWLVVLHAPPSHAGCVHPSGAPHWSLLVQAAQPAAVQ
jgi:hypothetical protein